MTHLLFLWRAFLHDNWLDTSGNTVILSPIYSTTPALMTWTNNRADLPKWLDGTSKEDHYIAVFPGQGSGWKRTAGQQVARLLWDTSGRWVHLRKQKSLPTGVENISLEEDCLTLAKTAPAVLFITSLEKLGLAEFPSPFNQHTHTRAHMPHPCHARELLSTVPK